MEVINAGMRKGIKIMCVTTQTMQFISLMPKPKDFVTRIVGDVVYLSSQIKRLSDDMNKLLDSYAEIPGNYLMTQMNSITGSLTGIVNRVEDYANNAVNQTVGLAENAVNMVTELTGSVIDTTGAATSAIVSLGAEVAHSSAAILGDTDTAEDIHSGTEVILEWTNDGFQSISDTATAPLKSATQKLVDARTSVTNKISGAANAVTDKIGEAQKWVETLITELRDKMKELEKVMDSGFKDVTGMSSVANGSNAVTEALKQSDNNSPAAQITTAVTSAVTDVIKNFSIGKMVLAFGGLLTQSVIVRLGLDKLPPIDFESMLCGIRDDMEMSSEDLYNQYNKLMDSTYNDYIKFGEEANKIPTEDRNYSDKNYKEFINKYNTELKEQRDNIRTLMKDSSNHRGDVVDVNTKKEIRSAIKEVEKYRKQVKNARQTTTLKDIIGSELDNFKKEAEYRCNSLKSDWKDMMNQYKESIKEIKRFFTSGGSCDMYIDDCCDKINQDFDDIKEICTSLITQLVSSGIKIAMPADIGPCVPNPGFKIPDFLLDIKTILKFIKDLLTLIIDIINNINKLARLMLNGLNNLTEIIKQLMELIGLKWLMDLVQSIIDLFGSNISNSKVVLENTLTPIYFQDTEEYDNTMQALEEYLDGKKFTDLGKDALSDTESMLKTMSGNFSKKQNKAIDELVGSIQKIQNGNSSDEDIENFIDALEEQGEVVVAYKSPIIQESGSESKVSDLVDGGKMDNDVKFIGWHFYHPDLSHTETKYYGGGFINTLMKKIKTKIIKKASKTGSKKTGGVAMLNRKIVGWKKETHDIAYIAFYWYTYYTEDLEKDCFEGKTRQGTTIIDSVIQTQNGSIVNIVDTDGNTKKVFVADNMVRSGDYVNVDGVKYRVK